MGKKSARSGCPVDFVAVYDLVNGECEKFFARYDLQSFYAGLFNELNDRLNIFDLEPQVEGRCGRSFNQLSLSITSMMRDAFEEALISIPLYMVYSRKSSLPERANDGNKSTGDWIGRIDAEDIRWARAYMADKIRSYLRDDIIDLYSPLFDEIDKIVPITESRFSTTEIQLVFNIIEKAVDVYAGSGIWFPVFLESQFKHMKKRNP